MWAQWGISIPMRDGVCLVANLFLADAAAGKLPVIVVRTPYGRNTDTLIEQARYFASHDYAFLCVDVRGRGDSEGTFVPYRNEGVDGFDTIEWAAAQPWCNGSVGTLGGSYLAKDQWLCAVQQPPHLKAMIPMVSPSDPFVEWPTGVPIPSHLCWLFLVGGRMLQNTHAVDWEGIYPHLPLLTMDEAVGRPIPMWREEFQHTQLDDWWKAVCYQTHFDQIDLPVLHISGWYDDEQIGTPLNFIGMTKNAPSEWARKAQRLLMGPWTHQVNQSAKVGDRDFGIEAKIDLGQTQLRFFDRWLKGIQNGLDDELPVKYFVMGANEWREACTWPLPETRFQPWYLHSHGGANTADRDGNLSTAQPAADEAADDYIYDPHHPVPFITLPTSDQIGGPDDYREVHERKDVLVFTSDAMDSSLEVTGPVKVVLYASTSARDTDFMAQVHDVWPNGYVQRLCDGMVRTRFRHGMGEPQLVEPGEIVKLEIDCWNTSHVFLPGHRIRIHITSSAFPKYDRNPNTGEALGQTVHMTTAKQTVYHSEVYPSAVILPVIG